MVNFILFSIGLAASTCALSELKLLWPRSKNSMGHALIIYLGTIAVALWAFSAMYIIMATLDLLLLIANMLA